MNLGSAACGLTVEIAVDTLNKIMFVLNLGWLVFGSRSDLYCS